MKARSLPYSLHPFDLAPGNPHVDRGWWIEGTRLWVRENVHADGTTYYRVSVLGRDVIRSCGFDTYIPGIYWGRYVFMKELRQNWQSPQQCRDALVRCIEN